MRANLVRLEKKNGAWCGACNAQVLHIGEFLYVIEGVLINPNRKKGESKPKFFAAKFILYPTMVELRFWPSRNIWKVKMVLRKFSKSFSETVTKSEIFCARN